MTLSSLLDIGQHDFITVTGGGGKTSLLGQLGSELKKETKTLITTTTKMRYPDAFEGKVVITPSLETLLSSLDNQKEHLFYFAGQCIEDHKVRGVAPGLLDCAFKELPDWIFLNEGDGAAGKPYKFYREREPVIPESTTKFVHVIGCEVLDRPMSVDNLHRCPEVFNGRIFDRAFFTECMEWFTQEKLKTFKIPRYLLVNKADQGNWEKAEEMCVAARPYFDGCIAASLYERKWFLC